VCKVALCLCGFTNTTRSDDHVRPPDAALCRTRNIAKSQQQQSGTSAVNSDAPQALANRRSTDIADLIAVQPQHLQGVIAPARFEKRLAVE
jgi:hypothetical protein